HRRRRSLSQRSLTGLTDFSIQNGNAILNFNFDVCSANIGTLQSIGDFFGLCLIASFLGGTRERHWRLQPPAKESIGAGSDRTGRHHSQHEQPLTVLSHESSPP